MAECDSPLADSAAQQEAAYVAANTPDEDAPRKRAVFDDTPLFIRYQKMRKLGGAYLTMDPWLIPPQYRPTQPRFSIPARHLHSAQNKIKHPINVVRWTPNGHRLLTGSASGEFTLWDGKAFNFVTIMSAHDSAVRAVDWSGSNEFMLSADQEGFVKYWTPQFNNVKAFQAHHNFAIRDICFAPTDSKFVTASDDSTLKIWDFATTAEHTELKGHGWDVKTCDWHYQKGLVVSGSKDHTVKLWDPRSGKCLTTLHGHKTPITKVRFGGRDDLCIATAARDSVTRIFCTRAMRDMLLLQSNEKDIVSVAWHPHHVSMVSTGSNDGAVSHYILTNPNPPAGQPHGLSPYDSGTPESSPAQKIWPGHVTKYAHEQAVWSMDWHPKGLVLATGSNDRATRFWVRPLPSNDAWESDSWHKGPNAAPAYRPHTQTAPSNSRRTATTAAAEDEEMDDAEEDALVDQKMPVRPSMPLPGLAPPGLPGLAADGTSTGGAQTAGMPMMMMPPDRSAWPNGIPPPPPGWVPPPGFPGVGGAAAQEGAGVRRRAPLPSQEDSYRKGY